MADEEIVEFVEFADVHKDGVIGLAEFIQGATLYEEQLTYKQLREAFDMFDPNNTGFISADEMVSVLSFMPRFNPEKG